MSGMMGSTHIYDVPSVASAGPIMAKRPEGAQMVELALDPSELDLDTEAMAARYEQQIREQQSQLQKEDLSDVVVEHIQRQKVMWVWVLRRFFWRFNSLSGCTIYRLCFLGETEEAADTGEVHKEI